MRSRALAILVVATLTLALQRSARAQDSTAVRARDSTPATRHGWIVGPLIGLPGTGSEVAPLVTLGVGVTRLVPNRMGLDFAVGTAPQVVAEGLVPVAARLGPSVPLAISPDAFLIPSAGLTAIAFPGSDDWQGGYGWYWGVAAVAARGCVGLRAGVTWHMPFVGADSPVWLAEIGFMQVPLPRRAH